MALGATTDPTVFSKAIQPTSITHGLDIITPYTIHFLNPSLLTGLSHQHAAGIEVIDEMSVKSAIYNASIEIHLKLTANTVLTVHGFDFLYFSSLI